MKLMAVNLISHRTALNIKSSVAVLSGFSREQRCFSDDSKKNDNLYKTLGIPSSSTPGEIKKAYYDLTLKYHPDKNINSEEAALKFREISEAYEILGNYRSRKRYDSGLPASDVKKVIKHTVDHKAQHQEFFDSRSTKHSTSSDARMKEIDDLGSYTQKNENEYVKFKQGNSALQLVFAIFAVTLFYFCRR